jgi:hypothetical protein
MHISMCIRGRIVTLVLFYLFSGVTIIQNATSINQSDKGTSLIAKSIQETRVVPETSSALAIELIKQVRGSTGIVQGVYQQSQYHILQLIYIQARSSAVSGHISKSDNHHNNHYLGGITSDN